MAIESVPIALAPTKPVPPAPSASQGTGKPTAESKAADKSTQEFRDLLEGLDTDTEVPTDGALLAPDATAADQGPSLKKPVGANKSTATGTTSADAATWMAAYLPPVPAPLAVPVSTAAASGASGTTDALQGTGPLAALKSDAAGAASNAAAAANAALPSVVPDARTQSASLANYASVFEQIQSRLAAAGNGAQDTAGQGSKGLAKPVLGTAAADARADQVATMASGGVWTMPVTGATALQAATDATEAMQLAIRETSDEREGLVVDKAPEGGISHSHFTPTVHFESAAASVDTSQPAPEAAVADQVSYWISQGIQNAELTFDGVDAQPVQVSISLSGNEAHVAFRTDQLETRDLLTGAAAHLKDLLQSQGMVLSGLSVGSSGAGGTNARERRAPSEGRQNTARSAPEVAAVRPTAPKGTSGRAVDLFV
ncbi:flagellar hook-length control protein FliK [Rhodoferax sp.]|uniref:flagellar hook-length control protein FliK n=1 Tax=Rhodoferax sp. TaxID=50421 RepID=UPI0025E9E16C|nr:flagellar hook-length control protein FliK [Rhodoferax sp.]